ncbi:thioredoxin family protein [Streptomyces sp. QH1-20]|uniref:thioredoxin family protein n=1 Tax=Streptomyces sp. QH1-20 TaxID=3240934 RepID=UPI0035157A95
MSVSRPVLVVASSPDCGYCRQLRSDLDANRQTLTLSGASVLLLGEGSPLTWGAALEPAQAEELTATYARLGRRGTPSAVRLSPGGGAHRAVRGFEAVTAALIELSGSEPGRVVCEVPTSCSAGVNGAPVDALVIAPAGGRAVGIAARGEGAVRMATLVAEGTPATNTVRGYAPVTLLVERPRNLWLVFRGGELVARSRSADEALDALRRIVAGFEPPGAHQVRLMCGALVRSEGGRALLFPRNWMSYLVARNASLARAGWRLDPDPFACLEPGPDGAALLSHSSRTAGLPPRTRVAGVLTPRPTALTPGPGTRARLLTQIVNWAVRPVAPHHVRTLCAWVADLPLHLGTPEEALAFLTRSPGVV